MFSLFDTIPSVTDGRKMGGQTGADERNCYSLYHYRECVLNQSVNQEIFEVA